MGRPLASSHPTSSILVVIVGVRGDFTNKKCHCCFLFFGVWIPFLFLAGNSDWVPKSLAYLQYHQIEELENPIEWCMYFYYGSVQKLAWGGGYLTHGEKVKKSTQGGTYNLWESGLCVLQVIVIITGVAPEKLPKIIFAQTPFNFCGCRRYICR